MVEINLDTELMKVPEKVLAPPITFIPLFASDVTVSVQSAIFISFEACIPFTLDDIFTSPFFIFILQTIYLFI